MTKPTRTIVIGIAAIACCWAAPFQAEAFEIQRIGTDKQHAFVGGDWKEDVECIEVRFATAVDIDPGLLFLRAYFFDADGKQILTHSKPSKITDLDLKVTSMPRTVEGGEKYTVYFAIPERFERGAQKWRRVVIVLGSRGERSGVTAKVYPKDDLEKFDFPEKAKLK